MDISTNKQDINSFAVFTHCEVTGNISLFHIAELGNHLIDDLIDPDGFADVLMC